jgi:hypothetical protein
MNSQRAAEIQVVLEGVPLPAKRDVLVEYAAREDSDAAAQLRTLPDKEYARIDEVGEALMQAPGPPTPPQGLPVPESGKPPGGPNYIGERDTEAGRVRHDAPRTNPPQQAIEQQTKKQKRQKQVQENG